MKQNKNRKSTIALLIPAHNEEKVIKTTILGAINAGIKSQDIYLVDDSSTDNTVKVAKKVLKKIS